MNRMIKYIVYETDLADTCVMFPTWVSHAQMAANLGHVLGAGFVNITVNTDGEVHFEAHGSSTSLGVCSRPEDTALLNSQFGK
jgi:hypothetical protein